MNIKVKKSLEPRRKPEQTRSIERTRQIMDVTAKLLNRVGFDDLTTILIAKELNISVGALYHYYPNKHAILRALAESWLSAWNIVLTNIEALPLEEMSIQNVVAELTTLFAKLYKDQRAVLPLAQAMFAVPEIRDLDEQHDAVVISCLSRVFKRIGVGKNKPERERIGSIYLDFTHAIMLINVEENGAKFARTMEDMKAMIVELLYRHRS